MGRGTVSKESQKSASVRYALPLRVAECRGMLDTGEYWDLFTLYLLFCPDLEFRYGLQVSLKAKVYASMSVNLNLDTRAHGA